MSESIFTARAGIFPCPNCRQMIYSDAKKCRFCSTTLDRKIAVAGADLQSRVNAACNQAKLLRSTAGAMWMFFLLGLIPFSPLGWGATILFYVIPAWLIYWQVKFGKLETVDKDYNRAKRERMTAFLIWSPAMLIEVVSLVIAAVVH